MWLLSWVSAIFSVHTYKQFIYTEDFRQNNTTIWNSNIQKPISCFKFLRWYYLVFMSLKRGVKCYLTIDYTELTILLTGKNDILMNLWYRSWSNYTKHRLIFLILLLCGTISRNAKNYAFFHSALSLETISQLLIY